MNFRIGQGIDIHKLKMGIPLYIGGVLIPYQKGSLGHSDGDVLYHSMVDAILGALAKRDIGYHFPSTNQKWENKSSKIFLEFTKSLLLKENYIIGNIDATIILQEPIISSYISKMKKNISTTLNTSKHKISIKATTTDHLGFIGSKQGIVAMSIVLIEKNNGH